MPSRTTIEKSDFLENGDFLENVQDFCKTQLASSNRKHKLAAFTFTHNTTRQLPYNLRNKSELIVSNSASRYRDNTLGHIFFKLINQVGIEFFQLPRLKFKLMRDINLIDLNFYNWFNKLRDKQYIFLNSLNSFFRFFKFKFFF